LKPGDRALALAVGLLLILTGGLTGGCTNDFDVFTPVADGGAGAGGDSGADGGGDGATGADARGDGAACTPDAKCISTAHTCSQNCPLGPRHQQCVQQCQQTCVSCTQAAACASPNDCANAVR
jgi:hypothetical protein